MPSGPETVPFIARITGVPVVPVQRAAKILRQAGLWARSPMGGGFKAEQIRAEHHTNMVLTLAMADPITQAAETVEWFRSLWAFRPMAAVLGGEEFHPPFGDGSLGWGLDNIQTVFRDPACVAFRQQWRAQGFHVVLENDPPRAWVRFRDAPHRDTEYRGKGHQVEPGENPQAPQLPLTFMQRPVILTCELFEALADLLEAPAEDAETLKVSVQDVPGPEKENAGLPGPASLANDTSLPGPVPSINNASLFDAPFGRQHAHTSDLDTRERSVRVPLPSRGMEDMAGHLSRSWPNGTPPQHP